jgi:hypothetical protein
VPVLFRGVVVGEGAAIERDGDVFGLAGCERYLVEAFQLFCWAFDFGMAVRDVDLRDLCACALAGVVMSKETVT